MEKPKIDIFIPTAVGHAHLLPASLCSALTQTYTPKRILLFLDQIHPLLEEVLDIWWYIRHKRPGKPDEETENNGHKFTYEYSDLGVLIRHLNGPAGSAHIARQWLFEWPGKSPVVKMLDADDILVPRALDVMIGYLQKDVDGVFCPMIRASAHRFAEINESLPYKGQFGSGSMMLRRECIDQMIQEGFRWPEKRGHDCGLYEFLQERPEKFNFVTTNETVIYLYLK